MMLTNTPKFYSHAELYQQAKPVDQKPVQQAPYYEALLYACVEALL